MKRLAPLLVLSLAGCATVLTPRRCEEAAAGLGQAAEIAQVLIDRGLAPAKAHKLADAVAAGRIALAAACAQAGPAPAPAAP